MRTVCHTLTVSVFCDQKYLQNAEFVFLIKQGALFNLF